MDTRLIDELWGTVEEAQAVSRQNKKHPRRSAKSAAQRTGTPGKTGAPEAPRTAEETVALVRAAVEEARGAEQRRAEDETVAQVRTAAGVHTVGMLGALPGVNGIEMMDSAPSGKHEMVSPREEARKKAVRKPKKRGRGKIFVGILTLMALVGSVIFLASQTSFHASAAGRSALGIELSAAEADCASAQQTAFSRYTGTGEEYEQSALPGIVLKDMTASFTYTIRSEVPSDGVMVLEDELLSALWITDEEGNPLQGAEAVRSVSLRIFREDAGDGEGTDVRLSPEALTTDENGAVVPMVQLIADPEAEDVRTLRVVVPSAADEDGDGTADDADGDGTPESPYGGLQIEVSFAARLNPEADLAAYATSGVTNGASYRIFSGEEVREASSGTVGVTPPPALLKQVVTGGEKKSHAVLDGRNAVFAYMIESTVPANATSFFIADQLESVLELVYEDGTAGDAAAVHLQIGDTRPEYDAEGLQGNTAVITLDENGDSNGRRGTRIIADIPLYLDAEGKVTEKDAPGAFSTAGQAVTLWFYVRLKPEVRMSELTESYPGETVLIPNTALYEIDGNTTTLTANGEKTLLSKTEPVTVTPPAETVNLTLEVHWNADAGREEARPAFVIRAERSVDGFATFEAVTGSEQSFGREAFGEDAGELTCAAWQGLAAKDAEGRRYEYRLSQVKKPAGYESGGITAERTVPGTGGNDFVTTLHSSLALTYDANRVDIDVTVRWRDDENALRLRPEALPLFLEAGVKTETGTRALTEWECEEAGIRQRIIIGKQGAEGVEEAYEVYENADSWSMTLADLPKLYAYTAQDGEEKQTEIVYRLSQESPIPTLEGAEDMRAFYEKSAESTSGAPDARRFTVSNTLQGTLTLHVEKEWVEVSESPARPERILVTVTGDGKRYPVEIVPDENGLWRGVTQVPHFNAKGAAIRYTIAEAQTPGYVQTGITEPASGAPAGEESAAVPDKHESHVRIQNTERVEGTLQIDVHVLFRDEASDVLRPEELKVYLDGYVDGKKVDNYTQTWKLTKTDADEADENTWSCSFLNLNRADGEGREIVWRARQDETPGYEQEIPEQMERIGSESEGHLEITIVNTLNVPIGGEITLSAQDTKEKHIELTARDAVFSYAIETTVPRNAKFFTVSDTIEPVLFFVSEAEDVEVKLDQEVLPADMQVRCADGESRPLVEIDGQTLSVHIPEVEAHEDAKVLIRFDAAVRSDKSLAGYDGAGGRIPNTARYQMNDDDELTEYSNVITVSVPKKPVISKLINGEERYAIVSDDDLLTYEITSRVPLDADTYTMTDTVPAGIEIHSAHAEVEGKSVGSALAISGQNVILTFADMSAYRGKSLKLTIEASLVKNLDLSRYSHYQIPNVVTVSVNGRLYETSAAATVDGAVLGERRGRGGLTGESDDLTPNYLVLITAASVIVTLLVISHRRLKEWY